MGLVSAGRLISSWYTWLPPEEFINRLEVVGESIQKLRWVLQKPKVKRLRDATEEYWCRWSIDR